MVGKALSELYIHKELIASVLPLQPQVKSKHRNTKNCNLTTKARILFRFLIDFSSQWTNRQKRLTRWIVYYFSPNKIRNYNPLIHLQRSPDGLLVKLNLHYCCHQRGIAYCLKEKKYQISRGKKLEKCQQS